ncbi:MAG: carboxypeptidase regulatory-like domain-containing protein [Planctomycetota bacterium]
MKARLLIVGGGLALLLLVVRVLAPGDDPRTAPAGGAPLVEPASVEPARPRRRPVEAPRAPRPGAPLPAPASARAAPFLSGVVIDPAGRPLRGARVGLEQGARLLPVDASGRFTLRLPPDAAPWVVWAERDGYAGRHVPVLDPTIRLRVTLAPGGALVGYCQDPDGRPVAARVEGLAGDWSGRAHTDAGGRFVLEPAPEGLVEVHALPDPRAGSCLPARGAAVVRAGGRAELVLVHARGQQLLGRVLEPSGAPAARAEVRFRLRDALSDTELAAETDEAGRFALPAVPAGEGLVVARRGASSAGPLTVLVPLGSDPDALELQLAPNPDLRLRVSDSLRGAPVALARCRLRAEAREVGEERAGLDGEARFAALGAGDYLLTVEAAGYSPSTSAFSFDPARPAPLAVELEPGARLRVRVVGPDGQPVPEAELEVLDGSGRRARADAQGAASLGELPAGVAAVRARAPGLGSGHAQLELGPGQEGEVTVFLSAPAALRGLVRDEGGAALGGAVVRVQGPADERLLTADEAGRFELTDLGPGPFRVEANLQGYLAADRDWVDPGAELTLVLERALAVVGRVRTLDGQAVHAVLVAPGEAPERSQLFEGARFVLVVGARTRELVVRARAGQGEHTHGPGFLSPLRVAVPQDGRELVIELAPGAEATGVVVDRAGRPLPGAAFLFGRQREEELGGAAGRMHLLTLSEDEGRFELPGVPPEGLLVTVSHPELAPLVTRVLPGPQRLVLPPGAALSGRVLDPDGASLPGVGVLVDGPVVRRLETDGSGAYQAKGLAPGRYRVTRVDTQTTAEVELAEAGEATLDLR